MISEICLACKNALHSAVSAILVCFLCSCYFDNMLPLWSNTNAKKNRKCFDIFCMLCLLKHRTWRLIPGASTNLRGGGTAWCSVEQCGVPFALWLYIYIILSLKILSLQLSEHHLNESHHASSEETRQHKNCLSACHHETAWCWPWRAAIPTLCKPEFCSTIRHVARGKSSDSFPVSSRHKPLILTNYKNLGASFTGSRPPKMIRSATLCWTLLNEYERMFCGVSSMWQSDRPKTPELQAPKM